MDETNSADKAAGSDDATGRNETLRTTVMVKEIIDSSTAGRRYQPEVARVSWTQRVLGWVRRS